MAGGYLKADREFGMTDVYPAFRFTRWHLIDIFIYFSHHFVTLPPLSWINLAHRQGVRVYGTLIFESYDEKFQAIFVEDENLDSFNHFKLAHKLDQIRRLSGFEGWLMNFEITLPEAIIKKTVGRILNFLRLLKNLGSEVIWYDSLTLSGKLEYQNALTGENKAFLDTGIDGIFLNYNWNDELLGRSQDTSGSANNSSRVFVGVDCFGRGCPGGGGFGTPVALNMILNAMRNKFALLEVSTYHTAKLLAKNPSDSLPIVSSVQKRCPDRPLSVALFAPGWAFEKCDLSSADGDPCQMHSLIADWDDRFWAPLADILPLIRGQAMSRVPLHRPTIPRLPVPHDPNDCPHILERGLILETTCCTGQGLSMMSGEPGSCMRMQQLLPTCCDLSTAKAVDFISDITSTRSFQVLQYACCVPVAPHGTCLLLRRLLRPNSCCDPRIVELFSFGQNSMVSAQSVFHLTVSLGCCSAAPVFRFPDESIDQLRRVFGLVLLVDMDTSASPVRHTSEVVCEIPCERKPIPFSQAFLVPTNGDEQWVTLVFYLAKNEPQDKSEGNENRSLSLRRISLKWSETEYNSQLLLGLIRLFDPSWLP
ncbi:Cytosolic endo-beta-N-acetylglucosaminidase [Fasciola hepatica]|uniref:Cytosolic endo-beta-N-acetylglucosaminidase n=1 Tax=Fasciola hepatica TaxID=6192 RepID=A0A4E0S3P2_FASHE|nr:Cytosolic endo-beta-N-acetylglucosaminidase [Fasciola hepatica]